MPARARVLPLLAALCALPLAGCGGFDNSALSVAVIAEPEQAGQPQSNLDTPDQLVRGAIAEGLVSFDEQGRVIPALADRWIVTDDGQSYIFRLRDGNWANGDEITAESAKRALDRAIRAQRKAPFARDLSGIDEIRVMAGRVVEIRLQRPMPYLLQMLAQPEMGLLHDRKGAGPMSIAQSEEGLTVLAPIDPARLGLPEIENWAARTRPLRIHALPGARAVEAFNEGAVDLVLGGQIQDFPLTRSVGILRGTIQLDPVVGLFGLQVMNDKGFLAESANREAIAMAIDREALIAPFGVSGWSSTTRIVTPSLDGDLGTIGERWAGQSLEDRRAIAAARVRAWRTGQGVGSGAGAKDGEIKKGAGKQGAGKQGAARKEPGDPAAGAGASAAPAPDALQLRLWLPEGEGATILFRKLSADLATIGVTLARADAETDADLALLDDVARYPRAAWFLNRLSCSARRGLCSADADARVAEAMNAPTPADRAALMTEAEAELTSANVYIPFGPPIRWSLVRGSVDGFATNAWGWHPLMPLSWVPK